MIIKLDDFIIDCRELMFIRDRLEKDKIRDPQFFREWHGSSNIDKVFEEEIRFYIREGTGVSKEFRLEAKIVSGRMEEYPIEDRTTCDGWVGVDDFKLDDYHSNFLTIGNEFRIVPNDPCLENQTFLIPANNTLIPVNNNWQ